MVELEYRYFVLKGKDINGAVTEGYIGQSDLRALEKVADAIHKFRLSRGKEALHVLCIEKDWPEYEDFKSKILHRAAKEEIVDRITPILKDNLAFPDDVIRQVEKIIDSALPKEPSDGRTS